MKHHMVRMFIETEAVTTDWSVGKEVLTAFAEAEERLVPEGLYYWNTRIADFETVEQCEPHWAGIAVSRLQGYPKHEWPFGLSWRRIKTVKYQVEFKHSQTAMLGGWNGGSLSLYAAPHKKGGLDAHIPARLQGNDTHIWHVALFR